MKTLRNLLLSLMVFMSFSNAEEMVIDTAHSEVSFSIKHMMISNVKGEFNDFDAKIDYDVKRKKFNSLSAIINAASVDTGITKRDKHLKSSDFFEVEKFPEIKFVMIKYKANGSMGVIFGDLTIKDITKRVTLNVLVNGVIKDFSGKTRVGFTLKANINRKDYGLQWNKALELGGFAVGDKVKIVIELETVVK
jgi:polyisoprenoid-binding protein YceI